MAIISNDAVAVVAATAKRTANHIRSVVTVHHKFLFIALLYLSLCSKFASGHRHSPLFTEEGEIGRRNSRPAVSECQFGKTLHELGSTWYADLGPPFGVMYCIICECKAMVKGRRIVAGVQCRRINNECPPLLCDDPVALPGKCCKICPGDRNDTDIALDAPAPTVSVEEEERNTKHFAALLTGRTSYFLKGEEMKSMYSTHNPHNVVATGRFLFYKKNLYYSFYISSKTARPRAIQFVDEAGTILEEHQLQLPMGTQSIYQNVTGKICGVWRRVPRDYKRLLRDERLNVVLLWSSGNKEQMSELALAGKIAKYTALQSEWFSSLLEAKSDQLNGAGGTAIVSVMSGAASAIHLTLVFNGVFAPEEYLDVPINVRIELLDRKEVILDEIQKVRKPSSEINTMEISSPITLQNLRLMARGKLVLTIESKKNPNLRIQGPIVTRTSCEIFQTLLTPHNAETKSKSSGLAWVFLNTDGSMSYNIETDQVNARDHPEISLIEDVGKRKMLVEDLTPSFNFNQAIGIIDKLGPKVVEALYAGDLAINIGLQHEPSLIRGSLLPKPVADARDSAEPILLKRSDSSANTPAHAMGMAWLSIDNECNLHYEITLSGFPSQGQDFQVYLEEKPIEAIGAPVTRNLLEEFSGTYMEGFVLGMASNELTKLESSVCYLEIHSKLKQDLLLRGKLKTTKVPPQCFPTYTDNNVLAPLGDHNDESSFTHETKCYHSGRFYDVSEQWRSTEDTCQMCACQRGHAKCEPIKCPELQCKISEELVKREGECCSICLPQNIEAVKTLDDPEVGKRGCRLGNQFHLVGAIWHPFLPPNGFDTCTTCRCDAATLEVKCPRVTCPPLNCKEKDAYRPEKKACCKVCAEGKLSNRSGTSKMGPPNPNVLQDQGIIRTPIINVEEILKEGGCKVVNKIYENGDEWHPILASHGEQKCITCRCKDSKVSCNRKRCSRSDCQQARLSARKKIFDKPALPYESLADECCTTQCKRTRRHNRRMHQQQQQQQQLQLLQQQEQQHIKRQQTTFTSS